MAKSETAKFSKRKVCGDGFDMLYALMARKCSTIKTNNYFPEPSLRDFYEFK